jgi:transposase-like protein
MPRKAKGKRDSAKAAASPKPEVDNAKATEGPAATPRRKKAKRSVRAAGRPSSRGRKQGRRGSRGRRYTDAERQRILETARREGLSGPQVRDRFGVSTLTYYTWRKKGGAGIRRRGRAAATGRAVGRTLASAVNLADAIRQEVRTHIGHLLPGILKDEVGRAVSGSSTGPRARRRQN